jgi:hypothetical protein
VNNRRGCSLKDLNEIKDSFFVAVAAVSARAEFPQSIMGSFSRVMAVWLDWWLSNRLSIKRPVRAQAVAISAVFFK